MAPGQAHARPVGRHREQTEHQSHQGRGRAPFQVVASIVAVMVAAVGIVGIVIGVGIVAVVDIAVVDIAVAVGFAVVVGAVAHLLLLQKDQKLPELRQSKEGALLWLE